MLSRQLQKGGQGITQVILKLTYGAYALGLGDHQVIGAIIEQAAAARCGGIGRTSRIYSLDTIDVEIPRKTPGRTEILPAPGRLIGGTKLPHLIGTQGRVAEIIQDHRRAALVTHGAPHQTGGLFVVIGAICGAIAEINFNAFDVFPQHYVDHPGDGIRAIDGRGAVLEYIYPLNGRYGNAVDIDKRIADPFGKGTDGNPATIDQHQGRIRPHATQADGGGTVGGRVLAVAAGRESAGPGRRHPFQQLLQVIVTHVGNIFFAYGLNGRWAFHIGTFDPRACDFDTLHRLLGREGFTGRGQGKCHGAGTQGEVRSVHDHP